MLGNDDFFDISRPPLPERARCEVLDELLLALGLLQLSCVACELVDRAGELLLLCFNLGPAENNGSDYK